MSYINQLYEAYGYQLDESSDVTIRRLFKKWVASQDEADRERLVSLVTKKANTVGRDETKKLIHALNKTRLSLNMEKLEIYRDDSDEMGDGIFYSAAVHFSGSHTQGNMMFNLNVTFPLDGSSPTYKISFFPYWNQWDSEGIRDNVLSIADKVVSLAKG